MYLQRTDRSGWKRVDFSSIRVGLLGKHHITMPGTGRFDLAQTDALLRVPIIERLDVGDEQAGR